jgi:hypothetical protein
MMEGRMDMTQEQLDALNALLEYSWQAERDDYADNPDGREGHIFRSMVVLENMYTGTNHEPEYWLTEAEKDAESHYQEATS